MYVLRVKCGGRVGHLVDLHRTIRVIERGFEIECMSIEMTCYIFTEDDNFLREV